MPSRAAWTRRSIWNGWAIDDFSSEINIPCPCGFRLRGQGNVFVFSPAGRRGAGFIVFRTGGGLASPVEEFFEKEPLVVDRVVPVEAVVHARPHDVVVVDPALHQLVVEVAVYFGEKVAVTAVDDQRQVAVGDAVDLVDRRVVVPALRIVGLFAFFISQLSGNGRMSNPPLVDPAAPKRSLWRSESHMAPCPPMLRPVMARPLRSARVW